MGKKTHYPESVKREVVELKLNGTLSNKEIMDKYGIKNVSQIKTWVKWFRNGELHRFAQPIGKQYTYGKGPEELTEVEQLKRQNTYLELQVEVLKKYQEIERRWSQKL